MHSPNCETDRKRRTTYCHMSVALKAFSTDAKPPGLRPLPVRRNEGDVMKQLMSRPDAAVLIGVHNALGAKIAEESGADGLWISSFEVHTAARLPDADILGTQDYVNVIQQIVDRVGIPVLVDGNAVGGTPSTPSAWCASSRRPAPAECASRTTAFPSAAASTRACRTAWRPAAPSAARSWPASRSAWTPASGSSPGSRPSTRGWASK